MSGARPAPVLGAEMRAVRRELAGADDARVLQVLRYVDQLADRGQADGLLAPLRDRLRRLRPARPLRFSRLLFMPMDAAMVNPRDWHAGAPQVPRSAIPALVGLVRAALPVLSQQADRIIEDNAAPEEVRVRQAGLALWPQAAVILRAAAIPAGWDSTGLPPSAFAPMAHGCAVCLQAGAELVALADPGVPAVELNQTLSTLLTKAEREGALAWGMLLTVMLQRFPEADAPRRAAATMRADRALRDASEAAVEASWQWIERSTGDLGMGDPADAASELRRQATLLDLMTQEPAQRRRAIALQANLHAASTRRLEEAVQERLVAPLRALVTNNAKNGDIIGSLEADARALRRLEAEIRRLGKGGAPEALLHRAAASVIACSDMASMDRARLIELLQGPQAALTHLTRKP